MAPMDFGVYLVGFVRPLEDRAEILGSGIFVRCGNVYGILTANHVVRLIVDELKHKTVGIVRFPIQQNQFQQTVLKVAELDLVQIGHPEDDSWGPDIAFVRLPLYTAVALRAASSFFDFKIQAPHARKYRPRKSATIDCVLGAIAEWKTAPVVTERRSGRKRISKSVTTICALHNIGRTTKVRKGRSGFDRYKFVPTPEKGFKMPSSFEATSGGGLVRCYVEAGTARLIEMRLFGVAFYQSDSRDGKRYLICHGPKSIYQRLLKAMKKKWGNDLN